jgi:hypothetical protein
VFNLDPRASYVALEKPQWAGGGEGRVYAADLVQYDDDDAEIERETIPFHLDSNGYYPEMGVLQRLIERVNSGAITRRPPSQ